MASVTYALFAAILIVYTVSAAPADTELLEAQPKENLQTASSIGYGYGSGLGYYYPYHGYNNWGAWGYPYGYGYGYGHGYGSGLYGYWW